MTEKQEKILSTALRLFAEQGFDATSTNKVAKEAGVSEGLIFRHFENKEGLLNAIMQQGKEMAMKEFAPLLESENPVDVIHGVLKMGFELDEQDFNFWKLLYQLKWQTEIYDDSISSPMREKLEWAFAELSFRNPAAEAEIVLMIIDGLATSILLRKPGNINEVKVALLNKYNL